MKLSANQTFNAVISIISHIGIHDTDINTVIDTVQKVADSIPDDEAEVVPGDDIIACLFDNIYEAEDNKPITTSLLINNIQKRVPVNRPTSIMYIQRATMMGLIQPHSSGRSTIYIKMK